PGLPLWLPKGGALIEELEKLAKETEFAAGYARVRTPHIAREKMYKTSGHLPYYAESMFPPMILPFEGNDIEKLERVCEIATLHPPFKDRLNTLAPDFLREFNKFYRDKKPADLSYSGAFPYHLGSSVLTGEVAYLRRTKYQHDLSDTLVDLWQKLEQLFKEIEQLLDVRYYLKAMNCPHHHRIFAA